MTSDVCTNKEIRREYIESFVKQELAKVIFDDGRIPILVKEYEEFRKRQNASRYEVVGVIQKKIAETDKKISNIVSVVANTGSTSLLSALQELEKEKSKYEGILNDERSKLENSSISEEKIRKAYRQARDLFLAGELDEQRQLINLYVDKILVYKEHVEIFR